MLPADPTDVHDERKQLRVALDAAGLGTWRLDERGGAVHLDARAQGHFGLTSGAVALADLLVRVHPDDRGRLEDRLAPAELEEGAAVECRVVDAQGRYRQIELRVTAEAADGAVARRQRLIYGSSEDVTERRAAERLLAEQAALLHDVGEIAQIGGWHFDTATGEGNWTEETLRIHGITGQPDSAAMGLDRFPGEARATIESALHEAITRGTPYDLELPFEALDGAAKWVRAVCRPVVEDGRVVRLRGTLQDVTVQKRLEEQLRQSQKLEAIGQLAGGVAHDFNNLLTVVVGNLELLGELLDAQPEPRRLLDEIHVAADRASALTRQLLAFGRKSVLRTTAIDVDATVARVARMLRHLIGEDVDVRAVLGAVDARVVADEGQFEQILMNLALNARDAMPSGGMLSLATSLVGPDGGPGDGWVRLTVSDTGVGMSPEVQRRMFEPFFTTKPVGKGTGLGLATVFGAVKQCDGCIDVRSTPGAGTTFVIDFPRTTTSVAEPLAQVPGMARGHETVLLIEDDAAVRRVTARSLTGEGYRVLDMPGPTEALARLAELPPVDLVITDVVMPGMSGRSLAELVRKQRPGVRVLFMTGYIRDALDRQGLSASDNLLQKPFTRHDLVRRVREVLDAD